MRQVKSPSKFTSYEKLLWIKENNYIGVNGQEYEACEVDSLLWQKESNSDESTVDKMIREYNERFADS